MNNTNSLLSGDNKGHASLLMEQHMNGNDTLPGRVSEDRKRFLLSIGMFFQGDFVAAFAQSNEGDVSPNTLGAFCGQSDKRCDFNHSTCGGRVSKKRTAMTFFLSDFLYFSE